MEKHSWIIAAICWVGAAFVLAVIIGRFIAFDRIDGDDSPMD